MALKGHPSSEDSRARKQVYTGQVLSARSSAVKLPIYGVGYVSAKGETSHCSSQTECAVTLTWPYRILCKCFSNWPGELLFRRALLSELQESSERNWYSDNEKPASAAGDVHTTSQSAMSRSMSMLTSPESILSSRLLPELLPFPLQLGEAPLLLELDPEPLDAEPANQPPPSPSLLLTLLRRSRKKC